MTENTGRKHHLVRWLPVPANLVKENSLDITGEERGTKEPGHMDMRCL